MAAALATSLRARQGTPVGRATRLDDLFGLVYFLGGSAFGERALWDKAVAGPLQRREREGLQRLFAVLGPRCLRRSKEMVADQTRVPPQFWYLQPNYLSPLDR